MTSIIDYNRLSSLRVGNRHRWASSPTFGDLEDQDQIIQKMWSWRSKIRLPKHCDLEDQDHLNRGSGDDGGISYMLN